MLVHLRAEQDVELLQVIQEMPYLLSISPGRTQLVEHVIRLKDGEPVPRHPYRVSQQLVEKLEQEVEEMLKCGVIEPSNSEWCSPVVIVFKKG